jgi:hypothetical protein
LNYNNLNNENYFYKNYWFKYWLKYKNKEKLISKKLVIIFLKKK